MSGWERQRCVDQNDSCSDGREGTVSLVGVRKGGMGSRSLNSNPPSEGERTVETRLAKSLSEIHLWQERYRAVGESIPFGIWICDAQGATHLLQQSDSRIDRHDIQSRPPELVGTRPFTRTMRRIPNVLGTSVFERAQIGSDFIATGARIGNITPCWRVDVHSEFRTALSESRSA
jgi:hypothetical protein